MKPSIGRIVHYVSYGTPGGEYTSECRAAVVTQVGTGHLRVRNVTGDMVIDEPTGDIGEISLCVLNPSGLFFNEGVRQDEETKAGGTWHWPERVE